MRITEIILRIALAMVIGGLIGWERESTHRPAGIRTHMLVSVGAAVIMLIGEFSFHKYAGMTNLDPTRLGAQVISGIGFLGAGTIMRDGYSIRGLTTAAGIWSVACLGLAAGIGFYEGAILGTVALLVTLRLMEKLQKLTRHGKRTRLFLQLTCENSSETMLLMNRVIAQYNAELAEISVDQNKKCSEITTKIHFNTFRKAINYNQFVAEIAASKGVYTIKTEEF